MIAVALGLRLRGIDVSTTVEERLTGATDEQQLAFATGQGRVLVTHDADFLRLHEELIRTLASSSAIRVTRPSVFLCAGSCSSTRCSCPRI
jgi:predicted nuclease of predicted toxin-antitoxin system